MDYLKLPDYNNLQAFVFGDKILKLLIIKVRIKIQKISPKYTHTYG